MINFIGVESLEYSVKLSSWGPRRLFSDFCVWHRIFIPGIFTTMLRIFVCIIVHSTTKCAFYSPIYRTQQNISLLLVKSKVKISNFVVCSTHSCTVSTNRWHSSLPWIRAYKWTHVNSKALAQYIVVDILSVSNHKDNLILQQRIVFYEFCLTAHMMTYLQAIDAAGFCQAWYFWTLVPVFPVKTLNKVWLWKHLITHHVRALVIGLGKTHAHIFR